MFQSVVKCFMITETPLWHAECIQLWGKCRNKMPVKGFWTLAPFPEDQTAHEKVSKVGFMCVCGVWSCAGLGFFSCLFIDWVWCWPWKYNQKSFNVSKNLFYNVFQLSYTFLNDKLKALWSSKQGESSPCCFRALQDDSSLWIFI